MSTFELKENYMIILITKATAKQVLNNTLNNEDNKTKIIRGEISQCATKCAGTSAICTFTMATAVYKNNQLFNHYHL